MFRILELDVNSGKFDEAKKWTKRGLDEGFRLAYWKKFEDPVVRKVIIAVSDAEPKRNEAAAEAQRANEKYDCKGLVLLKKNLKGVEKKFSFEITGTVVNRRTKHIDYAQITFMVYDQSGAHVECNCEYHRLSPW